MLVLESIVICSQFDMNWFRDYIFYADFLIDDDIVRIIMKIMFTTEVVTRYPHWKVLIEPFFSIKLRFEETGNFLKTELKRQK